MMYRRLVETDQIYWRFQRTNAPPFSAENAKSMSWAEMDTGYCIPCDGTGDDLYSGKQCKSCGGTGEPEERDGYSCCYSLEDLRRYFADSLGSDTPDNWGDIIVFRGKEVGKGIDHEPLVIPTQVLRVMKPSVAFRRRKDEAACILSQLEEKSLSNDLMPIVQELMGVLTPGLPVPEIKVVNQTRANWLGVCAWKMGKRADGTSFGADNTTIELQKSIMSDETTMRKVIAHELCHHEDYLVNCKKRLEDLGFDTYRMIARKNGHGEAFRAIASRFNAKYGPDFVTEKSDQSYVLQTTEKPYFLFIYQHAPGKFAFQVSTRMTPKGQGFVQRRLERYPGEYKLVQFSNPVFLQAPTIGSDKGWSVAKNPPENEQLEKLFNG